MSTQNREEPAVTTDKPVTTSKYSIRLLDPLVEVFDDIAARLDTTRTARIEQHMLSDVRLHGTPDEIAAVEQALANRPRPGPKKRPS